MYGLVCGSESLTTSWPSSGVATESVHVLLPFCRNWPREVVGADGLPGLEHVPLDSPEGSCVRIEAAIHDLPVKGRRSLLRLIRRAIGLCERLAGIQLVAVSLVARIHRSARGSGTDVRGRRPALRAPVDRLPWMVVAVERDVVAVLVCGYGLGIGPRQGLSDRVKRTPAVAAERIITSADHLDLRIGGDVRGQRRQLAAVHELGEHVGPDLRRTRCRSQRCRDVDRHRLAGHRLRWSPDPRCIHVPERTWDEGGVCDE